MFDLETKSWIFNGFSADIPLADPSSIGLLSSEYKILIDSIPEKAGGFGILDKFSYGKSTAGGFKGVISGNIVLRSNSLSITCTDQHGKLITATCATQPYSADLPKNPAIDINFSTDFLDTLCIEIPGGPGVKGPRGKKGKKGLDGTGDGPQGEQGDAGVDATGIASISSIQLVESDAYYQSAVVGLSFNQQLSLLEVIKAPIAVPDSTSSVDQVVVTPIGRSIEFTGSEWDYSLIKPSSDVTETSADCSIIGFPQGFDPKTTTPTPTALIKKNLSDYVDSIITKYKAKIVEFTAVYDAEMKQFMFTKDDEARKALDALVAELASLSFNDTIEFCMSMENNGSCGQQLVQEFKNMNSVGLVNIDNDLRAIAGSDALSLALSGFSSSVASAAAKEVYAEATGTGGGVVVPPKVKPSDLALFNASICNFAIQILEASGSSPSEAEIYCPDDVPTSLGNSIIEAGEKKHYFKVNGTTSLPAGAYIIQYVGGWIYDGGRPDCGYVVGQGDDFIPDSPDNSGLVIVVETESDISYVPFPKSTNITDHGNYQKVQEGYLTGPITEMSVGVILENDSKMYFMTPVKDPDTSYGEITVAVTHCSKCES